MGVAKLAAANTELSGRPVLARTPRVALNPRSTRACHSLETPYQVAGLVLECVLMAMVLSVTVKWMHRVRGPQFALCLCTRARWCTSSVLVCRADLRLEARPCAMAAALLEFLDPD